jgi:uncharacterized protein YxjI
MRYIMKQKLFCWGDDFVIRDEEGRDRFFVDGKAFTLAEQLSFQDTAGRELAYIRQRLLAWGPTYEIYRGGAVAAVVKKELFTFFKCRFQVDVPGPDDPEATGDFLDLEYQFVRRGRPIATVSKRWFALADTYGVEIAAGEDDVLLLAATVVIDMVCHADSKR